MLYQLTCFGLRLHFSFILVWPVMTTVQCCCPTASKISIPSLEGLRLSNLILNSYFPQTFSFNIHQIYFHVFLLSKMWIWRLKEGGFPKNFPWFLFWEPNSIYIIYYTSPSFRQSKGYKFTPKTTGKVPVLHAVSTIVWIYSINLAN